MQSAPETRPTRRTRATQAGAAGWPPVPALRSLLPDGVCYAGSVSKLLAPALRIGWLLVPPRLRDALVTAKRYADLGSSRGIGAWRGRTSQEELRISRRARALVRRAMDVGIEAEEFAEMTGYSLNTVKRWFALFRRALEQAQRQRELAAARRGRRRRPPQHLSPASGNAGSLMQKGGAGGLCSGTDCGRAGAGVRGVVSSRCLW